MAGVIHIAEVAAILAVAYVLGWGLGYLAHLLLARMPVAAAAAVPVEAGASAVVAAQADAAAFSPVVEPMPINPPPVVREPEPAPQIEPQPQATGPAPAPLASVETMSSVEPVVIPPVDAAPAATAIEPEPSVSTPAEAVVAGLAPLAIPVIAAPPPLRLDPLPRRRPPPQPAPPPPPPEPEVILTATPAVKPGEAWSGTVRGRAAGPLKRVEDAEPVAAEDASPAKFDARPVDVPLVIDLGPVGPDSTHGEPVLPAELPPRPEATAVEPAPRALPVDEDAAMRAIEGGWSRSRTRSMTDSPELSDVGVAVAAAQSAVEQVLARAGIDPDAPRHEGKPPGLLRPRDGKRDDLKRINGLGVLDESTLNNLGVYHFDQIAGWSGPQVLWMESHVFARGRIGRENWQEQARALASAVAG